MTLYETGELLLL